MYIQTTSHTARRSVLADMSRSIQGFIELDWEIGSCPNGITTSIDTRVSIAATVCSIADVQVHNQGTLCRSPNLHPDAVRDSHTTKSISSRSATRRDEARLMKAAARCSIVKLFPRPWSCVCLVAYFCGRAARASGRYYGRSSCCHRP